MAYFSPCHKILEDKHVMADVKQLQKKYVLAPADKAGNNIIFVCKYYYIHTHTPVFHVNLQQKEKHLPQTCWIPKLHKTPYKARFIAGSSSCTTTKRIYKLITECLKLIKSHCTSYCKTILERTGFNCMWIINNSMDVCLFVLFLFICHTTIITKRCQKNKM